MNDLHNKLDILKKYLSNFNKIAIAFSGGIDSTFLLKVAHEIFGEETLAITINSPLNPIRELEAAIDFTNQNKINHKIINFDPFEIEGFKTNPTNRCYICKKSIFEKIMSEVEGHEILEGSNLDDEKDYRPGRAAINELGIKSPLKEALLTKEDIRKLSKEMGLQVWNKPSFSCLATRFPYNTLITEEMLLNIEKAEQFLIENDFNQVRLRHHDDIARIEICEEDFPKMLENKRYEKINAYIKHLGYKYVTFDLAGYRTGSMNIN